MTINRGWLGRIGVLVALATGCGDSGDGSSSMSMSESQSGTSSTGAPTEGTTGATGTASMSATENNEGGISDSISGTTSDEGGISDSVSNSGMSGNETISGSGSTGETGNVSGGGETSASTGVVETTGTPIDCEAIVEEQECVQSGCLAVKGRQISDDGAIACIEDVAVFIGCIEAMGCDDVLTTVCKGDVQYQLPDGCYPQGFTPCDPPPDVGGDGYPACP